MGKLLVRAVGTALVTEFDAMENGIRRFVGRKFVPDQGFAPVDATVHISDRAEHVMAVKDGDLEACDEATAIRCGVKFEKQPIAVEPGHPVDALKE